MAASKEIEVSLPGGRRVDARIGAHVVHTDQPRDNGGDDTAPSPFDLFLASIGACAGIFVQGFCAKRGIATEGIRIIERPSFGEDGVLRSVELEVQLPPEFPERYRGAVQAVVEQCSVKKAIAAQPVFTVRTSAATPLPTPHTPATTGAAHQAR